MKNKQNNGFIKNPFLYILIIVILVTGFQYFFTGNAAGRSQQINYTQLVKEITDDNVKEISYQPNGSVIEVSGTYKSAKESKDTTGIQFFTPEISKVSRFTSVILPSDTTVSDLQKLASEHKTEITIKRESSSGMWINIFISIVPFMFIAFFLMSMMNQGGGGGARGAMNFGRNKARATNKEDIKVRFSDVAGAEEEKQELREIKAAATVDMQKISNPEAYKRTGKTIKPLNGPIVVYFRQKKAGVVESNGIEIRGKVGNPIVAAKAGTVIYASNFEGLGKVVMIDYGGGMIGVYGNLLAIKVGYNSKVSAGQTIGVLGLSSEKEPNLYYELRANLRPIDPIPTF